MNLSKILDLRLAGGEITVEGYYEELNIGSTITVDVYTTYGILYLIWYPSLTDPKVKSDKSQNATRRSNNAFDTQLKNQAEETAKAVKNVARTIRDAATSTREIVKAFSDSRAVMDLAESVQVAATATVGVDFIQSNYLPTNIVSNSTFNGVAAELHRFT